MANLNEKNLSVFPLKPKKNKSKDILSKRTGSEKILFAIVFMVFLLYGLSLLFPFLYLLLNSLKASGEYIDHLAGGQTMTFPKVWLFSNYKQAFTKMAMDAYGGERIYLPEMFFNSIWYSFFCVLSGVTASSFTSYCLAKYRFKLRSFFYGIAIFTMTIPIVGSTGAMFKLVNDIGIYDTPLFPIIASFGGFGFNFLIMYGFFSNIPWSYAEAVFIDGGGHKTVFFKIMLPQAWPTMLALSIMSFITSWNDYMSVLLYLPNYPTLASGIYQIEKSIIRGGNYPVYFAGIIISVVPIIVLFSCFSDMIMKNFTVGGLKG